MPAWTRRSAGHGCSPRPSSRSASARDRHIDDHLCRPGRRKERPAAGSVNYAASHRQSCPREVDRRMFAVDAGLEMGAVGLLVLGGSGDDPRTRVI
jgi:hypothetical protein